MSQDTQLRHRMIVECLHWLIAFAYVFMISINRSPFRACRPPCRQRINDISSRTHYYHFDIDAGSTDLAMDK
jgi:hypothetical protein